MDKNEFYKQLMSEYTFNADKIRENAKRGKSSRQKLSPMYIGMSAAAAVCVVTVGTIAAVNLGKSGGVTLTDTGLTQLNASDRLSNALEQLELERGSTESKDFLVTFSSPMSASEAQSVLTGYSDGSIPVKQLYFSDGTKLSGADNIGEVFTGSGSYKITGAAIYCSGNTAAQLQSDPSVFLVEAMEESDFDNAAPVNIAEIQTTEVTLPDSSVVTEPVVAPPNVPINPDNVYTTEDSDEAAGTFDDYGTVEELSPTEEMDGTSEPYATEEASKEPTAEAPGTTDTPTVIPDTTTAVTPGTSSEEPTVPVEKPQEQILPSGVTLPENPETFSYNTYIDADSAFFLNNDTIFVKTGSDVALYRYTNSSETLICSEEISDAKIVWVAENGGKLMVTGMSDFGTRGRTLLVDADNDYITDLHTEDSVMSGTLMSASYNADSQLLVLNVREEGRYYICVYKVSSSGENEYIGTPFESSLKTAVAASGGNTIYLTQTENSSTTLIAVDAFSGNTRTVHSFGSVPVLSRNLAFTHAVFVPDENSVIGFTEIFDPETEKLIPLYSSDSTVNFGASRHSFTNGGSCYIISGGSINSSGGISALAAIEYRKSFSTEYAASVSGGTVRISRSIYTSANKSGLMTFSDISESAPNEFRKTLNGAIGINNALALDTCAANGITKPQTLIDCISLYYSANASQKIMTRCGISPYGALRYENGGLTAITASETALVINSQSAGTASGVLYIKAGSFGGKTAYRSVNVSFVKENGVWKLDTVL